MVIYMNADELEKAFSDFLDSAEYDRVEGALFELIRMAFVSGWNSAKRDNIKMLKPKE